MLYAKKVSNLYLIQILNMKKLFKTLSTLSIFMSGCLIFTNCSKSDIRPQNKPSASFRSNVEHAPTPQLSNICPSASDHKEKVATEIAQVIFDKFYNKRRFMPHLFGHMSQYEYQSKPITDLGKVDAYYTIRTLTKPHIVGKATNFWKKDALKGAIADFWQKVASLDNCSLEHLEKIRDEVYRLSEKS